jgi:hypothetical protein
MTTHIRISESQLEPLQQKAISEQRPQILDHEGGRCTQVLQYAGKRHLVLKYENVDILCSTLYRQGRTLNLKKISSPHENIKNDFHPLSGFCQLLSCVVKRKYLKRLCKF